MFSFSTNYSLIPAQRPYGLPFMQDFSMSFGSGFQQPIFQQPLFQAPPILVCPPPISFNNYYPTPSFTPFIPRFDSNSFFKFNTVSSNSYSSIGRGSRQSVRMSGNLGSDIVSTAKSYLGYNEADNSYKLFTGGSDRQWCADFVTYVTKQAYKDNGKTVPSGFGSSSCRGLKGWAEQNNCFFATNSLSNKADAIKQNVKPGDIMILTRGGGKGHTGIVVSVDADGFTTVEGNTSDKVATRRHSFNQNSLVGFVQMG